jgi:hypothetical protein
MRRIGVNIAILLCFIASISTFDVDLNIIKALITGGLIGIWLSHLVKWLWRKS